MNFWGNGRLRKNTPLHSGCSVTPCTTSDLARFKSPARISNSMNIRHIIALLLMLQQVLGSVTIYRTIFTHEEVFSAVDRLVRILSISTAKRPPPIQRVMTHISQTRLTTLFSLRGPSGASLCTWLCNRRDFTSVSSPIKCRTLPQTPSPFSLSKKHPSNIVLLG